MLETGDFEVEGKVEGSASAHKDDTSRLAFVAATYSGRNSRFRLGFRPSIDSGLIFRI